MAYRLGVDVGGTFTDLLLINEADSSFHIVKVPSTQADPSTRCEEDTGLAAPSPPVFPSWVQRDLAAK